MFTAARAATVTGLIESPLPASAITQLVLCARIECPLFYACEAGRGHEGAALTTFFRVHARDGLVWGAIALYGIGVNTLFLEASCQPLALPPVRPTAPPAHRRGRPRALEAPRGGFCTGPGLKAHGPAQAAPWPRPQLGPTAAPAPWQ